MRSNQRLLQPFGHNVGQRSELGPQVAGTQRRYNNIQIDGANNNDLFALAGNSGNPGGGTGTQPISFDAIQEIQLVVAPYDVRQGGFSGGGINAITRSGTNAYHGTASCTSPQPGLATAPTASATPPASSSRPAGRSARSARSSSGQPGRADREEQGLLLRERRRHAQQDAFRLLRGRLVRPDVRRAAGRPRPRPQHPQEHVRLRSVAGREPAREFTKETPSNKFFVPRGLQPLRQPPADVRNNYTKPTTDIGFPSNSLFLTPDSYYQIHNRTNSTVAQLNSTFGVASTSCA